MQGMACIIALFQGFGSKGLPFRPMFGALARSTQWGVNIGYPTSGLFRVFANGHFERPPCSAQHHPASQSSRDPSRHWALVWWESAPWADRACGILKEQRGACTAGWVSPQRPGIPGKWKEGSRIARASARARVSWGLGGSRRNAPASLGNGRRGRASRGRQPTPASPGGSVGLAATPRHPWEMEGGVAHRAGVSPRPRRLGKDGSRLARASARVRVAWGLGGSRRCSTASLGNGRRGRASHHISLHGIPMQGWPYIVLRASRGLVQPIFGALAQSTQPVVKIGYPTSGRFRVFANSHFARPPCSAQCHQASPSSNDPSWHGAPGAGGTAWPPSAARHGRLAPALCLIDGRHGGASHGRQPVPETVRGVPGTSAGAVVVPTTAFVAPSRRRAASPRVTPVGYARHDRQARVGRARFTLGAQQRFHGCPPAAQRCIPEPCEVEGNAAPRAGGNPREGLAVIFACAANHNSFCCASYANRVGRTRSVTRARERVPRRRRARAVTPRKTLRVAKGRPERGTVCVRGCSPLRWRWCGGFSL